MKLAVRLAVPVLAVAALAGCAPSSSTAVVVGGTTITRAEVGEVSQACREIRPEMQESTVVRMLTLRQMGLTGLEELGRTFDDSELKAAAAQSPELQQAVDTKCWAVVEGDYLLNALPMQLSPEQLDVVANVPVELNPRYGSFDSRQGWDDLGGSLSVLSEK